jgi:hypothetical protein
LTSRGTEESDIAHNTTQKIFLRKWKTTFEYIKQFTMVDGLPYKKPNLQFTITNPTEHTQRTVDLLGDEDGDTVVHIDGRNFTQQDVDLLLQLPYILLDASVSETYTLGNLLIKT